MRPLLLLCLATAASAAITGTVVNRTTGKPQAGATVGLNKLGQNGIELINQAKSGAQGHFSIDQDIAGQGPHLIRTAFDGVTYNHMLPPGSQTTDLTLDVYNASKQPGAAKVTKHMLLFEPSNGSMVVNETLLYVNDGKTAWDNDAGTAKFYLPRGTNGKVEVRATAPGGMPIGAPVVKTSKADEYGVAFPVKPGETRFDLTYTFPYQSGDPYEGHVPTQDENTYLISPNGVTLAGDNLRDLGTEPRTQAHIFGLQAPAYKIQVTGAGIDTQETSESSGPPIQQILPRVMNQRIAILAIALGILALGLVLLYRTEANGRGRR
jgi:hypothetical protein